MKPGSPNPKPESHMKAQAQIRFLIPSALSTPPKQELSITRLKHYELEADLVSGELRIKLDEATLEALRKIVAYYVKRYAEEFCRNNNDAECTGKIERLVAESVAGTIMHLLRTWIQTIGFYILK